MGRPESRVGGRAESRADRSASRVGRPASSAGYRPESRLHDRPMTSKGRMQERIDNINETRAQKEQEMTNEPDVHCSTKAKVIWMMFYTSSLPKAFTIVGSMIVVFSVVMTIIGFVTDSFPDGKTVGPVLGILGIIALLTGIICPSINICESKKR